MKVRRLILALVPSAALLSGCAVGPDYTAPQADIDAEFNQLRSDAGLTAGQPTELARWWTTLDDPALNQLIDRAVASNLDLRAATSRLRQVRALRNVAEGDRFPTLDASAGAQRSRASENVSGSGDLTTELYSSGFDAGWELDVFGGVARSVEAAEADVGAAVEARRDVLVSMLAEVALNYVEARSFQERLRIARDNLESQSDTFELVVSRHAAGLVQDIDLERARSNLERTRSSIPQLATQLERARNRLAVLLGEQPGALDGVFERSEPVPSPQLEVAIGVPADLLRRRPDIRQAERELAAETARVGVATAELYPKLRLNGSVGLEALSGGSLFESASRTFGIGSIVSWPLFSGGQIRNRIAAQSEVQQQAYIGWQAAVLAALEDVDNAVTAYANEQLRHASLERSAESAARAATLARSRYDAGVADFIEVLDADRERLSSEDALAASNAEITTGLIRLYKALGGGWQSLARTRVEGHE
ncbi:MAG: efflux transporter outer membrane subunit [Halomonas sp.]|uniref:efflux transporter outer membrane subunit n=1 Tax=Halomonas sp. TaxID=1486246 RepID=UPI0018455E47|nr:efflux transporter outer membrane subunit [Halomonas sp.]NWN82465.1 efflux transporter outer membrane subunit [Halomonas sp.]